MQLKPPTGPLWSHEFKFDGYRVQIHKRSEGIVVYSRRGADFAKRAGRTIVEAVICSLSLGLPRACQRCGTGKLFAGFLRLAERCDNCGLDTPLELSGPMSRGANSGLRQI